MELSIVIPIYNAGKFIDPAAQKLTKMLSLLGYEYEILFCDDASADESRAILERTAGQYPGVQCLYNEKNYGLGFTLRRLFKAAAGRSIVYCDCDLPFGVEILPALIGEIQNHDIVIVSRYLGGRNKIPILRRLMSRCYYYLCRMLFRISVKDIGSGTVAFRAGALAELDLKANGFDIHIEWLVQAIRKRLSIREIAASADNCSSGSFNIVRHGPRIVWDTIQLRKAKDKTKEEENSGDKKIILISLYL
mgnify:CR=1 FL=1